MIIDCHTHVWDVERHLSPQFVLDYSNVYKRGSDHLKATPDEHLKAIEGVDRAVVVAFRSRALGVDVPNQYVAEYVNKHPKILIGFCCVDPNDEDAPRELATCIKDLHLSGLKLGPIYQNFDPSSEPASRVFEKAEELNIPVLIHQGTTFVRNAPLKYAYPSLLDDVAIRFADLRIIIAHLGHPWEDETIAVVRKHPNVYTDVSALLYRPARFYSKLVSCMEYGILDKLIFGSDFPFGTPTWTITGLREINNYAPPSFPRIPGEAIEKIINKNALQIFES